MRSLLMGGQACIVYGGAEFSRDTDILVLADEGNLARLGTAVGELQAAVIAVPPFEKRYLDAGHAVHFRCRAAGVEGMRLDVMARVRGLPGFEDLWRRRSSVDTPDGPIDVLALSDLVTAKKTQRDKDWPMIARLVEADYAANGPRAAADRLGFWLREARTPALLVGIARAAPDAVRAASAARPLLAHALAGEPQALATALRAEEDGEREADRRYWAPLRAELERLRAERRG